MSRIRCGKSFPMACKGHFSRGGCICKLPEKEVRSMNHPLNSKCAPCLETAGSFVLPPTLPFI